MRSATSPSSRVTGPCPPRAPQDRVLGGDTAAAEDRTRLPADLQRRAHVRELAEADVLRLGPAGVLELAEPARGELCLLKRHRHLGELALGELESGDRPAE